MSIDIQVTEKGFETVIGGLQLVEVAIAGDLTLEDLVVVGENTLEIARSTVAFDTGALRESLQMFVDKKNLTVKIGTDGGIRPDGIRQIYGRFVELGTSRMAARPFLMPALLAAINEFKIRFPEKIREFSKIHVNLNRGK